MFFHQDQPKKIFDKEQSKIKISKIDFVLITNNNHPIYVNLF